MDTKKRAAILGTGATVEQCKAELASRFDIVLSTPHIGEITKLAESAGIDLGILCNPEAGLGTQLEMADALLRRGVGAALLRPAVPHGIAGLGLVHMEIGGQPLLLLPARGRVRTGSSEPVLTFPLAKRLFDIVFSASVLAVGLLVWCAVALAVKLQDGGPVFFTQDRVGPRGRRFRFAKFRTMWPDADLHREWYKSRYGRDGHIFKLSDDPRRTPFGRFLRRFSLDEAPQFLHALTGRMSIVGPRPPLPSEVEHYTEWQRRRLSGWFGLTGLWQVCGRAEVRDLNDIVLLDALYLHNHSLALDLRIILRTIRVVLSRHGAY